MKKAFSVVRYTLGISAVLISLLVIADGIYGFCTASHAPIYVNHEKSYIKSISQENNSLKCTVALCIKNIRHEQIECNKIQLVLRKNGDHEQFESVVAEPINPAPNYISFPGLRSKMIECTFVIDGFGASLSIDDVEISSLSYK